MGKQRHYKSTLARVRAIREITEQHYEPGNMSRCYKQVWRRWVFPVYGVCYVTYLRYLGIPVEREEKKVMPEERSLFDIEGFER